MKLKIAKELQKLPTVRIGDIQDLQGDLKDLTEINYNKLLERLKKVGFKYPLYIWFENKIPYTLDGKQRHRVIERAYGKDVVLPYIEVFAANRIEAKKEILAISSDYGTITKDGFDEFVADFKAEDFAEIELETTFDIWKDKIIDENVDLSETFDPYGVNKDLQRVTFIFDGPPEAESYLKRLKVDFKKMNMAWQVNLSTKYGA